MRNFHVKLGGSLTYFANKCLSPTCKATVQIAVTRRIYRTTVRCVSYPFKDQWSLYVPLALTSENSAFYPYVFYASQQKQEITVWI